VTESGDPFGQIVALLKPLLHQHGFQPVERLDAQLAPGTRHAGFALHPEAVRLVWDEGGGFVVLEALEAESGGTWTDMLLRFIDLRRAPERDLAHLVQVVADELTLYFGQVAAMRTLP
jgi:hypothetical protein